MLALIFFIGINLMHDFHLSKTEINFDTNTKSIQVATKVFIDDLELDLQYDGYRNLNIGTDKEVPQTDSLIADYFIKHLLISTNKSSELKQFYIGKELSEDLIAIWAYIEIPVEEAPSAIFVKNTILTKIFNDQKNMVLIKKDNRLIDHSILDSQRIDSSASF